MWFWNLTQKFYFNFQALNICEEIEIEQKYPENLWIKIGKKSSLILNIDENEFYLGVGQSFVQYIGKFRFDKLVSLIGREYREFVSNLDNVHQYLGERFENMKAPSYFVESETADGMTLIYR